MLPVAAAPDPSAIALPWDASPEEWDARLQAILDGLCPVQRLGSRTKAAIAAMRRRRTGKPVKPVPRAHVPLFRVPRSDPSFYLPSQALLRRLASGPLLEVGCGSGAWSMLVAAAGGDVVATDPRPWPMGHSYDHRDRLSDRSFVERQRATRKFASTFGFLNLVKPYPAAYERPYARFAHSRAAPPAMRFRKVMRDVADLRSKPTFHPVVRMTADLAVASFPGRDILLIAPDPRFDRWAADLLDSLEPGRRVYYLADVGDLYPPPPGYRLIERFQLGDAHAHEVMHIERIAVDPGR